MGGRIAGHAGRVTIREATMRMSHHALVRKQQRCIPQLVIDWLLQYGRRDASNGALRVWFDRRAKRELAGDVGRQTLSHLSKFLNAALIIDPNDDTIITIKWLH
jgi:hypothetical protein